LRGNLKPLFLHKENISINENENVF